MMDPAPTEDDEAPPAVVWKRRRPQASMRRREPAKADSDGDSSSSSGDDEPAQAVKKQKRSAGAGAISASSATGVRRPAAPASAAFVADRQTPIASSNDATKQSNWYDEDADAAPGRKGKTTAQGETAADGGTYRGLAHQKQSLIQKSANAPSRSVGPIKAPTNIRTITVTDFAPDVCKDYKQTGFCGFGDNCKFLHAREDYKQGWQLDKEWEAVTKGKKNMGGTVVASADRTAAAADDSDDDADAAMLENIPFACIICKEPYKQPVVTRCGHYFCERCALTRYRRDPSCAACAAGTNGIFNAAKKLQQLLDRKRARNARRRREGDEPSSEEEE